MEYVGLAYAGVRVRMLRDSSETGTSREYSVHSVKIGNIMQRRRFRWEESWILFAVYIEMR